MMITWLPLLRPSEDNRHVTQFLLRYSLIKPGDRAVMFWSVAFPGRFWSDVSVWVDHLIHCDRIHNGPLVGFYFVLEHGLCISALSWGVFLFSFALNLECVSRFGVNGCTDVMHLSCVFVSWVGVMPHFCFFRSTTTRSSASGLVYARLIVRANPGRLWAAAVWSSRWDVATVACCVDCKAPPSDLLAEMVWLGPNPVFLFWTINTAGTAGVLWIWYKFFFFFLAKEPSHTFWCLSWDFPTALNLSVCGQIWTWVEMESVWGGLFMLQASGLLSITS